MKSGTILMLSGILLSVRMQYAYLLNRSFINECHVLLFFFFLNDTLKVKYFMCYLLQSKTRRNSIKLISHFPIDC